MLTRRTADDLEITQAEYDALVWIRDALDPARPEVSLPRWLHFDMSHWIDGHNENIPSQGCGTIACLGGSMKLRMAGLSERESVGSALTADPEAFMAVEGGAYGHSVALSDLFFTYPLGRNWEGRRSRELAVSAVDLFLSGQTCNPWGAAIRDRRGASR